MRTYVVTRIGSNGANQHMCQEMDVCFVEASSRKVALKRATKMVHCFFNQHLTVTAPGRVPADRWNALVEKLGMDNEAVLIFPTGEK